MNDSEITRRDFVKGGICMATGAFADRIVCHPGKYACPLQATGASPSSQTEPGKSFVTDEESRTLDLWQKETDLATAELYRKYTQDGDTRGLASLERLERSFEKVYHEAKEAVVANDTPAVWSVYNMGYIVKTRESLFSIDLVHRRAKEFAPLLDFALITHNHNDHWRQDFYGAMNGAGKTVVSNFLDNYGVRNWRRDGGYVRGVKTFKIKDVEIRTSLIDHNKYLIDYTTAFEVRIGEFRLYHTGDSGSGTEPKLNAAWGRPDLWLFFPGCGIDVAEAVRKINAKRIVFGHLWELGHKTGRLTAPLVSRALDSARAVGMDVSFALWGDRIA